MARIARMKDAVKLAAKAAGVTPTPEVQQALEWAFISGFGDGRREDEDERNAVEFVPDPVKAARFKQEDALRRMPANKRARELINSERAEVPAKKAEAVTEFVDRFAPEA